MGIELDMVSPNDIYKHPVPGQSAISHPESDFRHGIFGRRLFTPDGPSQTVLFNQITPIFLWGLKKMIFFV